MVEFSEEDVCARWSFGVCNGKVDVDWKMEDSLGERRAVIKNRGDAQVCTCGIHVV